MSIITCNEGWTSTPMDNQTAKEYAYALKLLGNYNIKIIPVEEVEAA